MSENDIEMLLERADVDRDGRVCYEEFVLLMIAK
jgi:Ca2+-binding EF-hand superfamily protein